MSLSASDLDFASRNLHLLNPDQKAEVLRLLEERDRLATLTEARNHFLPFVKMMWPQFIPGAHHTIMAEMFEEIAYGRLKRLIINMPPRFTKSELSSWLLPAWLLGRTPTDKIIQSSNTEALAAGFGRKVRNLVSGEGGDTEQTAHPFHDVFPDVWLAKDSQAAAGWHTNRGGEYFAIGVNGKVTGKGANCVSFGCKCLTRRGYISIENVKVGDEVLGYDHETGKSRWTHVRAVSAAIATDALVSVGNLVCTADHRVYTAGGYRPAREVAEDGDAYVLSLRQDLRTGAQRARSFATSVWQTKRSPNLLLQSVFPCEEPRGHLRVRPRESASSPGVQGLLSSAEQHEADMHDVRQRVLAIEFRDTKSHGSGRKHERVLFAQLLRGASRHARAAASAVNRRMQDLWKAGLWSEEILLNDLLQSAGFPRGGVHRQLVAEPKESEQARSRSLRILREAEEAHSGSPHQPRRDGPRYGQLDPALRPVPQPLSSARVGVSAGDLASLLSGEGSWVVDLQTGTENFFCEGVLAHNCAIIDDAHSEQEAKQAETNPAVFDTVWEWYSSGIRQRLQPGGAIVIPMTRWAKRDLAGRLIKQMKEADGLADKWEVISFPAILDEGQPTERSMWPGFWPLEELQKTRAALPVPKWQAQYMQEPASESAAILKRDYWRKWGADTEKCPAPQHQGAWNDLGPPACSYLIGSWDCASSANDRSHPSAYTLWGVFSVEDPNTGKTINNIILLQAYKSRMEFPELKKKAKEFYEEDMPDTLLIENKAAGMQLLQEFRSMGIPAESFTGSSRGKSTGVRGTGSNDKIARANRIVDIFASRYVWAPERRFAEEVIEQCASFPGDEDDLVDSTVQALLRFREGGFIRTANDEQDEESAPRRRKRYY